MTIAMQPIYTQTVGSGGASAINFNNIPQGFADLKIEISGRVTATGGFFSSGGIQFNGDSTASYSRTYLQGYGTGVYSGRDSASTSTFMFIDGFTTASATANTFSSISIYVPNYISATYKSALLDVAGESNSTSESDLLLMAGLWRKTAAITSMSIFGGATLAQYSTFTLYGITKG